MTLFEKNSHALQSRYPDLVKRINSDESGRYHLFDGGRRRCNVYSAARDAFCYNQDIDKQVFDNLNARQFSFARIVMFLGIGLGYEFYDYYKEQREMKKTRIHVLVEKDVALFKLAMQTTDFTEIFEDPNVGLFVGLQESELFNALSRFIAVVPRIYYVKSLEYISSGNAMSLDPEYHKLAMQAMRESITYSLESYGNDFEDSLIGMKNMFLNIEEIASNPGINELFGKFKGVPAVIASAGPSLDKSIEILKRCVGKAIIICPDTSLKILLHHGIKPNIFVCLERTELTYVHLDGLDDEQVEGVQFLSCPVVFPRSYESYRGPKMIMYRDFKHFDWLEIDRGMLNVKQSSGNQAFKVADVLGCDPIILVGQDLAFGVDGYTHATGAVTGEKHPDFDDVDKFFVKGNYVDQILTTDIWFSFLNGYIQDLAESDSQCINSTAGGAFIPGSVVMPFEDSYARSIESRPTEDYYRRISELFDPFYQSSDVRSIYARLLNKFDETMVYFTTLFEYLECGKRLIKSYIEAIDQPEIAKSVALKITDLKKNITGGGANFDQLVALVIQSYFIQFEMEDALLEKDFEGVALFHQYNLRYEEWFERMDQMIRKVYAILLDSKRIVETKYERSIQDID